MTPLQIKTFLWENGHTISSMAREIELEYNATFDSIRVMLTNLFYYGGYNAKLAKLIEEKYQLKIEKPSRPQTVRERMRRAA